jgi:hypothetical protein
VPQYQDLFIRDNVNDTGVYPSQGDAYISPDVIPCQGQWLEFALAKSSYSAKQDLGKSIVSPDINNIYVRVFNPGSVTRYGTVELFYALSSLLLTPATWQSQPVLTPSGNMQAPVQNASGNQQIAPGEIGLGEPPFLLQNLPVSSSDHYCFVAIVRSATSPVSIPASFSSNAAFTQWVQSNPAVGWRNVANVAAAQSTMVLTTAFGNLDSVSHQFNFSLIGQGLPVGSTIEAQCSDPACQFRKQVTVPAPNQNGEQVTGFEQAVPGEFRGALAIKVTAPSGSKIGGGAVLRVRCIQIPSADPSELEREVCRPMRLAQAKAGGEPVLRDGEGFEVGCCTILAGPGDD